MGILENILARAGTGGLLSEQPAPYLTPEQERSVLSDAGGLGLSGLQFIGGVLDTPGALIRTALMGLSGGQMTNPFSIQDRVYGRDLARQWGMASGDDTWGNFGGGLAIDILTDPLTYLTLGTAGAAKTAGQIGQKAGVLQGLTAAQRTGKTLRQGIDIIADGSATTKKILMGNAEDAARAMGADLSKELDNIMSGTVGLGLPFMKPLKTFNVPGMAKALDFVTDKAMRGKIPGLGWSPGGTINQLFNKVVRDRSTTPLQKALIEGNTALTIKQADNLMSSLGELGKLDDLVEKGLDTVDGNVLRSLAEGTGPGMKATLAERFADVGGDTDLFIDALLDSHKIVGETRDIVRPMVGRWHKAVRTILEEQQAMGLPKEALLDPSILFGATRQLDTGAEVAAATTGRALPLKGVADKARKEKFKGITPNPAHPGGTSTIQEIVKDQDLKKYASDPNVNDYGQATQFLLRKYLAQSDELADQAIDVAERIHKDPELYKVFSESLGEGTVMAHQAQYYKAEALAEFVDTLDPKYAKDGLNYFGNKYIDDLAETIKTGLDQVAYAGAIHKALARSAEPFAETATEEGLKHFAHVEGTVPIFTVLDGATITGEGRILKVAEGLNQTKNADGASLISDDALAILKNGDDDAIEILGRNINPDIENVGRGAVGTKLSEVLQTAGVNKNRRKLLGGIADAMHEFDALDAEAVRLIKAGDKGMTAKLLKMRVDDSVTDAVIDRLVNYRSGLTELSRFSVPKNLAKDITSYMDTYTSPEGLKPLLKAWDKVTVIFKANVTAPFVSFMTRNFSSGFAQDAAAGGMNNIPDMVYAWWNARAAVQGGTVKGSRNFAQFAGRNYTDLQATKEIRRLAVANDLSPIHGISEADDLMATSARQRSPLQAQLHGTPGGQNPSLLGAAKKLLRPFTKEGRLQDLVDFRNVPGGIGVAAEGSADIFAPVAAGQAANSLVEAVPRFATFIRKLKEGASATVAAAESKLAHVEFSKLTQFERSVMKRLIPWYTFSRHMIPEQLKMLAARPSTSFPGLAMRATSGQGEFVPEQALGAIPWGDEEEGIQKFLKLDLPHEVLNDLLSTKSTMLGTVQATGARFLSQLHPVIKTPLELVTNQSFFRRGRNLDEMWSHLGEATGGRIKSPIANALAMGSPLSRAFGTGMEARNLFDTNINPNRTKLETVANLTSGVRFQAVNIAAARDRAYTDAASTIMKSLGGKTLQNVYMPAGAQMSAKELASFDILKSLLRSIHGNAKQRARDNSPLAGLV